MKREFLYGIAVGVVAGVVGALAVRGLASKPASDGAANSAVSDPGPAAPPRLEGVPADTVALRKQLEAANLRVQQLTSELESARRQAPTPQTSPAPRKEDELTVEVREEAARLRVSEAALEAVWQAKKYYHADRATREQVIASLRPYGEEAIRATAALFRGGRGHTGITDALGALATPGGADVLIRLIEEDPKRLSALLYSLYGYDSPRVRDYLVERIGRETDPGAFLWIALVLGQMKEPRGAEAIRLERMLTPMWSGVRGDILYAIGKMGGPSAIRLLEDYLLLPSADYVGAALTALNGLDPERARSHAVRIKASDRYAFLDYMSIERVDALAAGR